MPGVDRDAQPADRAVPPQAPSRRGHHPAPARHARHGAGGEIAPRLESIYLFCQSYLSTGPARSRPAKIEQVSGMLGELRDAWATISGQAARSAPYERSPDASSSSSSSSAPRPADAARRADSRPRGLIAALPATPPASARPALERAALMNKRLRSRSSAAATRSWPSPATSRRSDRTARGYPPSRQRRSHIEATA